MIVAYLLALVGLAGLASASAAVPAASKKKLTQTQIQYNTINGWYDYLLFNPNIINAIENPQGALQFIDENVVYRYGDIGTLIGYVDANEFSLGSNPVLNPAAGYVFNNFTYRQYMTDGYLVWTAVDFEAAPSNTSIGYSKINYTEYSAWAFNDEGKIVAIDATVTVPGFAYELGIRYSDPAFWAEVIFGMCEVAMGFNGSQPYCSQQNTGYKNFTDCQQFLTNNIPNGTPGVGTGDNVFCRITWLTLVPLRPSVHCPTIGRTGGIRCNDTGFSYIDEYTSYPFEWSAFRGDPIDIGAEYDSATASSITVPAGATVGDVAATTGSSSQMAMVAAVSASVATVFGLVLGVLAMIAVNRYRKPKDGAADTKSFTEGRVIIVEGGMGKEQDVQLLSGHSVVN